MTLGRRLTCCMTWLAATSHIVVEILQRASSVIALGWGSQCVHVLIAHVSISLISFILPCRNLKTSTHPMLQSGAGSTAFEKLNRLRPSLTSWKVSVCTHLTVYSC